jgi:hypothetical protein
MRGSCAGRALLRQALLLPLVGALAMLDSGCSLVFTRGPELDRQPPEPCTPSNGYAIADTALALLSVAAIVGGSIAVAQGSKPPSTSPGEALVGLGLIPAGVIGTAIFVPSAVVGYNRAAACRAWLQLPSPIVPSSPPPSSRAGPRREPIGPPLFFSAPSPASWVRTSW